MAGLQLSENALVVLRKRYLAKDAGGRVVETPEQLFRRVARNIGLVEGLYLPEVYDPAGGQCPRGGPASPRTGWPARLGVMEGLTRWDWEMLQRAYIWLDRDGHMKVSFDELCHAMERRSADILAFQEELYRAMVEKEFMFNSPTLMNAGRELSQLSACFVLPVGDSLAGIFESIKHAALIHQSGGGTGMSFSRLRPKNDVVRTTGGVASGPVSFMRVFNAATEAIKQGGCVSPDTRVATEKGLIPIGELGPADASPRSWHSLGLRVMTDDGPRLADEFYAHGVSRVITVVTSCGYRVTATPEHRFRVIDEEGRYVWRRLADIRPGDWLALQMDTYPEETGFTFPPFRHHPCRSASSMHLPERPSERLGEFIGVIIADGAFGVNRRGSGRLVISVGDSDDELSRWLEQTCRDLFGFTPRAVRKPGDGGRDRFLCPTMLVAWLEHVGVRVSSPEEAVVPEPVFRAGAAFARGFLRGLFSAQATVDENGCLSLRSPSRRLLEGVQQLLLALGIPSALCTVKERPSATRHLPLHCLRLVGERGLARFARGIAFLNGRKNALLQRAVQTAPGNGERELACGNCDQFYDRVERLEPGESLTLDLSVPANSTYVANGFVSHNTRRGANMGILRVDHPDILEFVTCKQDNADITNFNISVGITEEFMQAVREDGEYDLINPRTGKPVGRLRAREVFDRIVEGAWRNGEPGIVFLDRLNRDNPTPELGEIESTNPCVTGDTWVATSDGPRQVRELVGRALEVVVNGAAYRTGEEGFFRTGTRPVVRLRTQEGYTLRLTGDHRVMRVVDRTRYRIGPSWVPVTELRPGDQILLHNHRSLMGWPGGLTEGEGYLLGLLVGDGLLKEDALVLSARAGEQAVNYGAAQVGAAPLSAPRVLAGRMCMAASSKTVTPEIERASSDGYRGFLRGLFDCDGSVQGSLEKGVSIRLAQSNLDLLRAVQRMLLRLGIVSAIHEGRRRPGTRVLPDGGGGAGEYRVEAQHELVIAGDNLVVFAERVGFGDSRKAHQLASLLTRYRGNLNRERFAATVLSVEDDGMEDVYDVHVPGVNAFDANGIYSHNCGEQPLLPYEACCLGSINLSLVVKPGYESWEGPGPGRSPEGEPEGGATGVSDEALLAYARAAIDWDRLSRITRLGVHFLDNIIDANKYPLPEIEMMARGNRKIGLGVMGWADMLIKLGIPYDSRAALLLADEVMGFIRGEAREATRQLAGVRGAFPNFSRSVYRDGPPVRNATLTTIAPTGTISIIAGCSSGIEPLFALAYFRKVLEGQRLVEVNPMFEEVARRAGFFSPELMHLVAERGSVRGLPEVPERWQRVFVTALEIDPDWHIRMQAAFQAHTDNAVSKTVNMRHEATREEVAKVYLLAYELGCKGVTIYRDRSREEQVLNLGIARQGEESPGEAPREAQLADRPRAVVPGGGESPQPAEQKAGERPPAGEEAAVRPTVPPSWSRTDRGITPRARPSVTHGITERIKTGCGNLYVTINEDEHGLCEVFASMGKSGGCAASQSEAVARLISLALRSGIQPDSIVKELRGIRCPSPAWVEGGGMVLSCPDAIGIVLERYLKRKAAVRENRPTGAPNPGRRSWDQMAVSLDPVENHMGACPECGGHLAHESGCLVCHFCGYSRCG